MSVIRDAFKQQLDNPAINDGDYLKGMTIEEKVQSILQPGSTPEIEKSARIMVERKIRDFADHIGQQKLMYIDTSVEGKLIVLSIWDSELADIEEHWELCENKLGLATPILKRKIPLV